jgi:RND superfamily putative drug exporter
VAPIQIVVDAARSTDVEVQIEALSQAMSNHPGLAGPATVQWNEQGDTAWIVQRLAVDATSEAAYETVKDVRESLVPAAFGTSSNAVYVTGDSAYRQDFFQVSDDRTIPVFIFVLGLSFFILLMAFRSLVVPVKAIIMNLLSVGAAYGLLVFVFQKGHGTEILGFTRTPVIEAWIPIFLFCVLFGLSMDYHVFLLSRIREFFEHGHANRESVAEGLQATARIITGAALIMVAVFAGFATGELVMMQQMGFGLAVAVLLDATVVRSVLVPATMALLGERNWYLPAWLNWIPDLRMEPERPPVGDRHSHATAD